MACMILSTPSSGVKYSRNTSGEGKFTDLISVNTVIYRTVKRMRHCTRSPREVVDIQSLELFKGRLDVAVSNSPLSMAGDLELR